MEQKKYYFIASLEKGLNILELLSSTGAMSVSQVAAALGYNRPGAHRFLRTLKELGYVQQTKHGEYEPSFKILELSTKVAGRFEIRKNAASIMRKLSSATKETINLGFIQGTDIIHLDKIDSPELLRMDPEIGSRAPAQNTALGKAILAFLPVEELEEFCAQADWKALTPNSNNSREKLYTELAKVRETVWALDNEELCLGLRCVAVPIFDHSNYPRYAISISGPSMRMSDERIALIQEKLLAASRELSQKLKELGQ